MNGSASCIICNVGNLELTDLTLSFQAIVQGMAEPMKWICLLLVVGTTAFAADSSIPVSCLSEFRAVFN